MLSRCISHAARIGVFAVALSLVILPAQARQVMNRIEGELVSPTGSPPCAFCKIQLEDQMGRSGTTLTSGEGEFIFQNLKDDVYRIRISSDIYEDVSLPVKLNPEITQVTIDLRLRKSETNSFGPGGPVVNRHSTLEFQSKDVVDLYKKALRNRLKNNFEEAARQYESISQVAPQLYVAHLDLGLSYQAIGRLEDAEREFKVAHDLDSSTADPLIHLGEVYILRGEWGYAAAASVNAIRLDPNSPQPFLSLGLAFYCSGMPELAKDSLERALKTNPKLDQARLLLVNLYLKAHDDRGALEQLDLYLSRSVSRSRLAELSALRSQLKNGDSQKDETQVSVPIRIGSTTMRDACQN